MRYSLFNVCLFGLLIQGGISVAFEPDQMPHICGRVTDSLGNPVGGVWVRGSRLIGTVPARYDTEFVIEKTTNQQGRFQFSLPLGASNEPIDQFVIGVETQDGQFVYQNVSIDDDQTKIDVDLRLRQIQTLNLSIIDEGGQPIRDATLLHLSEIRDEKITNVWDGNVIKLLSKRVPTSDGNGYMQIPFTGQADSYQVVVQHKDFVTEQFDQVVLAEPPTEIVMKLGRKIEFQLNGNHRPSVISNTVVTVQRDHHQWIEFLSVDSKGRGYFRLNEKQDALLRVQHPTLQFAPTEFHVSEVDRRKADMNPDYVIPLVEIGNYNGLAVDK